MEKNETLTEALKSLETQANEVVTDMAAIHRKLEIAYQYEHELLQRLAKAKEKTEALRIEYFKKSNDLNLLIKNIKDNLNIWTGNFYKSINL